MRAVVDAMLASTGPHSGECGEKFQAWEHRAYARKLQRGRTPESAESLIFEIILIASRWLQRGRTPESAESPKGVFTMTESIH